MRSFYVYNSLDPSSKFYTEKEYDEDGKLVAEPDATGKHKTSYRYAAGDGKLLGEVLPNDSEFAYGYDETGRVTAITHSTEDGEENANNTTYAYGCATEVRSGNNVVRYTYDHKRRVTAVELNGVENYVTYAYADTTLNNKKATKITATMKDNSSSVIIKDLHDNTLRTTFGGKTVVISNSGMNSSLNTENGYTYTAGSVVSIMPRGGMSNEATHCDNINSIGKPSQVTLNNGSYLVVKIGNETATIQNPVSLSALVVVLGDRSASITTENSTSQALDSNGVAWN